MDFLIRPFHCFQFGLPFCLFRKMCITGSTGSYSIHCWCGCIMSVADIYLHCFFWSIHWLLSWDLFNGGIIWGCIVHEEVVSADGQRPTVIKTLQRSFLLLLVCNPLPPRKGELYVKTCSGVLTCCWYEFALHQVFKESTSNRWEHRCKISSFTAAGNKKILPSHFLIFSLSYPWHSNEH